MLIDPTPEIEAIAAAIQDAPGPEDIDANLRFREKIVDLGSRSADFAKAVNLKCSRDPVFWFNTFVWTQNPIDFPDMPKVPVVLFPLQEEFVRCLHHHVSVLHKPLMLEKSREQLASVACSNYALWRLIYTENGSVKVGSFKKDVVDGDDYGEAIFPKIDFTIEFLPDWALPDGWVRKRPGPCRKEMMIRNPITKSNIKGETCNKRFSRSGRWPWLWLDEVAFVERQEQIHSAVGATTNCFVYTTTPNGLEMFASMVKGGNFKVFELHWTKNYFWHPINEKTGERYPPEQCQWNRKEPEKSVWPSEWVCQPGCKAHANGGMPHSQRYNAACAKLDWNVQKIAQELDIEYTKSGSTVFDQDRIAAAIKHLTDAPPKFTYYKLSWDNKAASSISAAVDDYELQWFKQAKHWGVKTEVCESGPLKVWIEPFTCRDKECACKGTGMHTYVLGGDTCCNVDGDYHCAYIWDATAGRCVAEWHGRGEPKKIALEWAKLCKWYGGSTKEGWPHAYASVEANNEGGTFNDTLDKIGIVVHVNRNESSSKKKRTTRLGVFLDRWNKPIIINDHLQPEISTPDTPGSLLPRLVVPFLDFWKEAQTFVYKYNDTQEIRPENPKMGSQTRKQHDDRVMAMAHAIYGCTVRFGKIRGFVAKSSMARHLMWKEERAERPTFTKI